MYFYPRSPCGERLVTFNVIASRVYISIHALLAESDSSKTHDRHKTTISIHALLAESDPNSGTFLSTHKNFYPRSPCGERLGGMSERLIGSVFLSTLSLRRATEFQRCKMKKNNISIHALLAESDSKSAQNSGALLRIWNKFYGDCIFMLTGKAVFYPFCPCFFHIFWCEGTGNFMIAFPSH